MKKLVTVVFAGVMALAVHAEWFDARISGYTSWPPAPSAVTGGVWTNLTGQAALEDLALLSGTAPQASVSFEADEGEALGFRASEQDLDGRASVVAITSRISFVAFDAGRTPPAPPQAKAGLILVKDGSSAWFHYLAKCGETNGWVKSSATGEPSVEQEFSVLLTKTEGSVRATYAQGGTVLADAVEVVTADARVSSVGFAGSGELFAVRGEAAVQSVDVSVDAASLSTGAHLAVVSVSNRTADVTVEPVGGAYAVPYGSEVEIFFRPVDGYLLTGADSLVLGAVTAPVRVDATLPGLPSAALAFRTTPYVQHPTTNAMTLMWLASTNVSATVSWWKVGSAVSNTLATTDASYLPTVTNWMMFTANDRIEYRWAQELGYDQNPPGSADNATNRYGAWEMPYTVPWQYRVRLTGLDPDAVYGYRVTLGGGVSYEKTFRTSPQAWRGFKFAYYSDSETEPKDNLSVDGLTSDWTDPKTGKSRRYFARQTEAYASNVCSIVDFGADLIVMAGDLAQLGTKQCDWDEFWRHNAGPLNDPAGSIPILASPGNHDYATYENTEVGVRKYLSYFEVEPNGTALDPDQQERFHRVDYGPVTFIFLDGNKGDESDMKRDTTRPLLRSYGSKAPDFNEGTPQYQWLETQLKDAQKRSAFTFIVTHQCPFSVGYHGRENGTVTPGYGEEVWSGQALRALLPLMHKYGVDGWLAGHDEMMERSVTVGEETRPDGTVVPHAFNVWDMGIAGDGLRGTKLNDNDEFEAYRADVDCPEIYENGLLVEGGKHYGHLEVTIDQDETGRWRATFDPVYLFFSTNATDQLVYGGKRHYADKQVRVSERNPGAAPAPVPVTRASVDYSHYVPTPAPQAVVMTFYDTAASRGLAWMTDTSVDVGTVWYLKGEYDQDDAQTFIDEGTAVSATLKPANDPAMNFHQAALTGLTSGTYSYRLGGKGHYVYGRFVVRESPETVTIVNFNDVQTKDATQLYKAENTISVAARTAGSVDFLINGGDFIDMNYFNNANHAVYTDIGKGNYEYWKWGISVDTVLPYFPGVPMLSATGFHDAPQYTQGTAVDYGFTSSHGGGCQSVDYGNVHVATLAYPGGWGDSQFAAMYAWLDADLRQASAAQWKVVCMHYGPYTTGDHAFDSGTPAFARLFAPMLSSNHVDLVLQAHDHTYSKTVPYRWDTLGYTSDATDATVLNLQPATVSRRGVAYDHDPRGTYYVSVGCCGHRVGEGTSYARVDGENSFTKRDPRIVAGKVKVDSTRKNRGDAASDDFDAQMFGVLRIDGNCLRYFFYVAEPDGTATLVDTLDVCKGEMKRKGAVIFLK